MAARLIVLYSQPEEPELFDAYYRDVHTPIVRRYPRIRGIRLTKGAGVGGRAAPYYLVAEMTFDSRADLDEALASDAGQQSARDLRNFATAGVTMLIADDESATDGGAPTDGDEPTTGDEPTDG